MTAPSLVSRPARAAHAGGSLGFEFFQNAYVVRDMAAAKAAFARYGVKSFTDLPMPDMGETSMKIALGWCAGHQVELIEAKGPGLELYTDWMKGGEDIRLHHFGYYVNSAEEWAELEALLKAEGREPVFAGEAEVCKFIYVNAPELGHYLEFVLPTELGRQVFGGAAAN